MSSDREARPDHPIHELIAKRWSPYVFDDRPVGMDDLKSLFEAARWAASSFNEQPWRYILATRESSEEFQRLLSCLVEGNREWAARVPVLALGVIRLNFSRNEKPNGVATHDLGLASANLVFEATQRGLFVHQMAGVLPDRARELYRIPEGFQLLTALAIGYRGDPARAPEELRQRDEGSRSRRPLAEFVFSGEWGNSFASGESDS